MTVEQNDQISQVIFNHLRVEASHGLDHAQETARLTGIILQEPEYREKLPWYAAIVLNHAGMLHDIGYTSHEPWWSGTQEEHPAASSIRAHAILKDTHFYQQNPELLGLVMWLIYNHDNTNYTFPAYWRLEESYLYRSAPNYSIPRLLPGAYRSLPDGLVDLIGPENAPHLTDGFLDPQIDLLQVLQEADSRLGDAKRTLAFCQKRGIPTFVNEGGLLGVGSLWWQNSASANIILALHRALLDAHTVSGQEKARTIYHDGMQFIEELYHRETADSNVFKPEKGMNMIGTLRDIDINEIFSRERKHRWDNRRVKQTSISLFMDHRETLRNMEAAYGKQYAHIASRIAPVDYFIDKVRV